MQAVTDKGLLIHEAPKLTLGQTLMVCVPCVVQMGLEQKEGHWLSPCECSSTKWYLCTPKITSIVNPAFFLSTTRVESTPEQECLQTIKEVYSSPLDLKNSPIENSDGELYMDRSSFVCNGKCMSGYAVTILSEVTESKAPMPDISAQKAELVALTQALELRK